MFFRVVLLVLAVTCVAPAPSRAGLVGVQYVNWFSGTDGDCSGAGWTANGIGPFGFPAGSVSSLVWPQVGGHCYSSLAASTAQRHGPILKALGIDFVLHDITNFSKMKNASANPIFQGALIQRAGLQAAANITSAFYLSITCWAEQCFDRPGDQTELFTLNEHVISHMEAIAALDPAAALMIDGKPLLLLYISAGSNVMDPANETQPYFQGPGHLTPLPAQVNPILRVGGRSVALRDVFTVRYFVVCSAPSFDYRPFAADLWGFVCAGDCAFAEAGYGSVLRAGTRQPGHLAAYLHAAAGRPYFVVRAWNEFSTTDEHMGQAYTLEPNSRLATVDGSPGADPWWVFNSIAPAIAAWKQGASSTLL